MNLELKVKLVAAIESWINKNCKSNNWPEIIVGNETALHMANAAEAVFDACLESQQYGIKNGSFEGLE